MGEHMPAAWTYTLIGAIVLLVLLLSYAADKLGRRHDRRACGRGRRRGDGDA